jgi:nucleoside 2-deoxyribosyltransferase
MKVYLAGPITGLTYGGTTEWRDYAIKELDNVGVEGISPMRGKDYLLQETSIREQYDEYILSTQRAITTRDRWDCTNCDVVLANLLGATERISIGTIMEYGWADAARNPIVTVMEKEGNPHDHAMVREVSGYRVETLDEALFVCKTILNVL